MELKNEYYKFPQDHYTINQVFNINYNLKELLSHFKNPHYN